MPGSIKSWKVLSFSILAGMLAYPIWANLGYFPVRIWDEARLAASALEMLQNGNYLVPHFRGNIDLWNTKPPLLIWLQCLSFSLFGITEWALRLPSALSVMATLIFLFYFIKKYLNNIELAFFSCFVLICSKGYMIQHVARTADYDASLICFSTISTLCFFAFTKTKKQNYLLLSIIALALAVLTKSIAGLLFLPGMFLYALAQNKLLWILRSKALLVGAGIFILLVAGYYLLREYYTPGYLSAVQENEWLGRYLEQKEEHEYGPWFYLQNLWKTNYPEWIVLFTAGGIFSFIYKDLRYRHLSQYCLILCLSYLLIISCSSTKLRWYDAPIYPLAAIIVGIFIFQFYQMLRKHFSSRKSILKWLPLLFVILLFHKPYKSILKRTLDLKEATWDKDIYPIAYYLQDALHNGRKLDGSRILYDGYHAHLMFYEYAFKNKGQMLKFTSAEHLKSGDLVILQEGASYEALKKKYKIKALRSFAGAHQIEISSK